MSSKKLRDEGNLEVAAANANSLFKSRARSASSTCCQITLGSLPKKYRFKGLMNKLLAIVLPA